MAEENITVLELISQSPTTSVYKAHQNALGRTVLLKVLHKHLLRDKDLVARFSREAKACAMLHSENIVQVYDLTEINGAPAIVMEFIEGRTLADILQGGQSGSEEFLVKLASAVLMALSYAHERGVIHRDIKPSNILISESGVIKVTDFGLAAVSDTPSLTIEGSLIGTPAYMSPEQSRGEPVDSRTDLFSLGVTLVEVMSGEKIFAGQSYTECIGKIQNFNLESLQGYASRCSQTFFSFLKNLLAPDKEDRFASAREALNALGTPSNVSSTMILPPVRLRRKKNYYFGGGALVILAALVWYFSSMVGHRPANTSLDSLVSAIPTRQPAAIQDLRPKQDEFRKGTDKVFFSSQDTFSDEKAHTAKEKFDTSSILSMSRLPVNIPPKADSGFIKISCIPWAKVYVDSEYAGITPIEGSIKVAAGAHTILFSNPTFAPIVRQVKVKPHLLSTISGNFYKNSGFLYITVHPWGRVYVDDQFRETTPSDSAIIVSAGTRRIRIENPHYPSMERTLAIKPGDTLRLNISFRTKGTR